MSGIEAAIPIDSPREVQVFSIKQDAIYGFSLEAIAIRNRTDVVDVEEVLRSTPDYQDTRPRKKLALARLDLAVKALMPRLVNGELSAIHAYLKIQEREAKLTGMDTDKGPLGVFKIDIPWLTSSRLSYKRDGEVIENVTDITPLIELRKAADYVPDDKDT
jgi:hypothetical protein